MNRPPIAPAAPADAAGVTEVVHALESSLYTGTTFSQADLEAEWAELDVERDTLVVRDGARIVGYAAVRERGEVWWVEGYVHPDALGRGFGKLIADVRVFRELRVELEAAPPAAEWPDGLRAVPFDPDHDALEFHAAHQEAFSAHWGYTRRDFETWSKLNLRNERFDPSLWCVVRAGDEIAAGTICTGDTYGGGWVHTLFTSRPWRRQGVGAALLHDVFGRFWERGERNVGLGVDAANETGAFRLYERAGMTPVLGWTVYEKELGESSGST